MYRKTNIGGQIQYDPKQAAKDLVKTFAQKRGVFEQVAKHYGVATTTVRRWLFTLKAMGLDIQPRIDKIRQLAEELD